MRPTRLQLLLGSGCVLLGLALGWAETAPALPNLDASPTPPAAVGGTAGTTDAAALSLTDIRARPPFWPDRRIPTLVAVPVPPAPPAPPPPPPPPAPSSELALVGIVNGPAARIAVFRVKSSGKLERHAEGDVVGQWSLERILIDRVVLLRGGAEDELAFPPPGERKSGQSTQPGVRSAPLQLIPIAPPPRP